MAVTNPFPHIRLKMIRNASKKKRQIVPQKSPQTSVNLKNRGHHAKTLETSVNRVHQDWQVNIEDRKANGYPELPEAISLFLKVDPKSMLVESLRSFGIEIIGELEEGYIIGASADLTLSDLAAKIKKFAQAGQNKVHMSAWAAAIDKLSWDNDIVFIVSAGNLAKTGNPANPGIREKIARGDNYPKYLYQPWARIANPAQSLQAITVGSVAIESLRGSVRTLAEQEHPSAFSRTGLGIWNTIKPELVEYGGDFTTDGANIPALAVSPAITPELVRSTLHGGRVQAVVQTV